MIHLLNPTDPSPSFWRSKAAVALMMLLVIGVFYLLREHYNHASQVLPYLPYLILLLCPLMHLFGHKHGGHGRTVTQKMTPRTIQGNSACAAQRATTIPLTPNRVNRNSKG